LEADDTYPGVFHDADTGTFLESLFAPRRGIVDPTSEWAKKTGSSVESRLFGKIKYDVARRNLGGKCEQLNVSIFLRPEHGTTLNLDSRVCDRSSEERIFTLIERLVDPGYVESLTLSTPAKRVLTKDEESLLKLGTAWETFYGLGSPYDVEQATNGGMDVAYPFYQSPDKRKLLRLQFSQSRSLVAWKFSDRVN
jgi:hypothetical protein